MISILDPRALIAAIALCAASVGIGYWRGNVAGKASVQAAWNQERAEQAAIVAQAASADATAGQQASATYQRGLQDEKILANWEMRSSRNIKRHRHKWPRYSS